MEMKRIIVGMIVVAGLSLSAQAADGTWSVDADGNWVDTANWVGGTVPGEIGFNNTDTATFSTTLTADRTVTGDSGRAIGLIEFGNTSGFGYTISGGDFRFNGAALPTSGGLPGVRVLSGAGAHDSTINSAIQLRGVGNRNFTFSNDSVDGGLVIDGNATSVVGAGRVFMIELTGSSTAASIGGVNNEIGGIISDDADGTVAVVKNGAGVWTLTANNSFEGGLTVNEGTLRYFGAGRRNFGTGTVTINDGVSFQKANTSAVLVDNDMVVNGDFTFLGNDTGNDWSGSMNLSGGARRITADADLTISGEISNGELTKNGSANLTLSLENAFSKMLISEGILTATADGALGTGRVSLINTGTLVLTGGLLNDYVDDTQILALGAGTTLAMDFIGSDTVYQLTLDNGSTYLAAGTYNAADLTDLGAGTYTGTGSLTVVIPEPATLGLLIAMGGGLIGLRRIFMV